MNMRIQKAVLAALAVGAAGSASAIDISTVPATNIIYASGSTAIDAALKAYFYNSTDPTPICDGTQGSIDVYAQASGAASKFTAVACMSAAGQNLGTTAGVSVPIAIIKEDGAGSLNGVSALQNITFSGSPFTTGGALNFPTVSQLTTAATACGAGTTKSGTGLQNFTSHSCSGFAATPIVPMLGFADVEGTLFAATDPTSPVTLTGGPTVQVVFAPAVSIGLYHALQALEGKTVGSDAPADMPSLSRTQLSAIYSGNVANGWAGLKNAAGTALSGEAVQFGSALGSCWNGTSTATGCTSAPIASASSPTIFICRRGQNSGTEVSAEVFFNDYGCANSAIPFKGPSAKIGLAANCGTPYKTDGCSWKQSYATLSATDTFAGNGTGDLLDCLVGQDQAGHFAVGFASVDNLSGTDQSNTTRRDFRYIRVDGVVPSIENAAAGKYQYISQSYYYYPPATVAWSAANAGGAVAANLLATITGSTQGIGTVGSVAGVNAASIMADQGFDGGVLVIPGNNSATPSAASASLTTFRANPVSGVWKTNGATNNCARPTAYSSATEIYADGAPAWGGPN